MDQQFVIELVQSGRPLGAIVRDYSQAVIAQQRAEADAKRQAEEAEFEQACAKLREWLQGYLPGVWETLAHTGAEPEFIPHRGSYICMPPPVTFFVGSVHLKLVQMSPTGVVEVSAPSGSSRRLGFTEDVGDNWRRFVAMLAELTGELPA